MRESKDNLGLIPITQPTNKYDIGIHALWVFAAMFTVLMFVYVVTNNF